MGISGSTSLFITSSTLYGPITVATFGTLMMAPSKVTMNNPAGMQYVVTGTSNIIYLSLTAANLTAPTAGTLYTKVYYT